MKKTMFFSIMVVLLLTISTSYAFWKDIENVLKGKVIEKTNEIINQTVNQATSQTPSSSQTPDSSDEKKQQKNENKKEQPLFESSSSDSDNPYKDITPLIPRNDLLQKISVSVRNFIDYDRDAVFIVSKKDPNLIYLDSSEGVYVSKDGGKTWLKLSFVVDKSNAINVPDTIQYKRKGTIYFNINAPGVFYLRVANGLLKSTDYGKTWYMVSLPFKATGVDINIKWNGDKSIIYAVETQNNLLNLLYMSTNDGKTWNKIKPVNNNIATVPVKLNNITVDPFTFYKNETMCDFNNNCSICLYKVDPKSLTLTEHEIYVGNATSIYNNYGITIDNGWVKPSTKKDIFYIIGGRGGVLSFNIKTKEIKIVFNERMLGNKIEDEGDTILIKSENTQETRFYSFDGGRSSTYTSDLVCGIVKDGELICLTKKLYFNNRAFNIIKITRDKQVIPWSAFAFKSPASYLEYKSSYYDSDYNRNERTRWYLMRVSIDKNIFVRQDGIYYGKEMVFKHDKLNKVVKVDHNEHVAIGQNGIVYVTTDPTLRNWTQLNIPYKHNLVDVIKEGNSYFFFAYDNIYEYRK